MSKKIVKKADDTFYCGICGAKTKMKDSGNVAGQLVCSKCFDEELEKFNKK
jgi:transcription elongation factor Elf1